MVLSILLWGPGSLKSAVTALDAGQLVASIWMSLKRSLGPLECGPRVDDPAFSRFHQGLCDSLTQELTMTVQAFVDGIPYWFSHWSEGQNTVQAFYKSVAPR